MSKNNKIEKEEREEKGLEEFRAMYEYIRDALSQGVPEDCGLDETLSCMEQGENGIESLIDYEKVDQYFDEKYGTKTLKNVAVKAAQMYAPRFISRKIAQDFLTEMRPEEDRPVRDTDIYAWETTEMDKYLGTIFFYARRRNLVNPLSHYVDKGAPLEKKVIENLNKDLDNICKDVKRYGEPASTSPTNKLAFFHNGTSNRFDFLKEAKDKYSGLMGLYPKLHLRFANRFKKNKKNAEGKD